MKTISSRYRFIVLLYLLPAALSSQNLVKNPGFETLRKCPILTSLGTADYIEDWNSANGCLFYNQCVHSCVTGDDMNPLVTGQITLYKGEGIAHIAYHGTVCDYMTTQLTKPLEANQWYYFEMAIFPRRTLELSSFGAYFSKKSLAHFDPHCDLFHVTPQVTCTGQKELKKWQKMTYCFQAQGGEEFMTLGSFPGPGVYEASDVFMDDLLLVPTKVNLGRDTAFCVQNPDAQIRLSAFKEIESTYKWQDGSANSDFLAKEVGTYWVEVTNHCGTVADTFNITAAECKCDSYIPNAFSPNNDMNNDVFLPNVHCTIEILDYKLQVFDRWGGQLFESIHSETGWDGNYRGKPCDNGLYIWTLEYSILENGRRRTDKKRGGVTIVR